MIATMSGSSAELSPVVWPSSISLTARPISHGISTVIPIAAQAKTSEPQSARLCGRRKLNSRRNVAIQSSLYKVKYGILAAWRGRTPGSATTAAISG
jgi:hypothetical protein